MRRLSKVEHEHYDKCRSVWTDFIDSLDANKGLHELKTRKLTIVPLFYKTSSEASGINKLADELFERGDDYLCYLVANSMDDFTSIEQGEVIRRVFNYGEAFFDSDNNDWKNYHRAILPVNQTDVGSIQRLMKYISLHRTKLFCNANGRPMESQIITRALQKLIKDNDLPPVVFHSLRHSSITYKLKLNGGDIKSVQGDSGHAQVKMVTDVYSHIIDEDRRLNAQRFEETFYQKKNPSEVNGATVEPKKEPQGITEEAMLNYMVQNPDFLQKFKVLLGVGN